MKIINKTFFALATVYKCGQLGLYYYIAEPPKSTETRPMLFWAQSKRREQLKTPTIIIIPANIQNVSAQHGRLILNRLPPLVWNSY